MGSIVSNKRRRRGNAVNPLAMRKVRAPVKNPNMSVAGELHCRLWLSCRGWDGLSGVGVHNKGSCSSSSAFVGTILAVGFNSNLMLAVIPASTKIGGSSANIYQKPFLLSLQ